MGFPVPVWSEQAADVSLRDLIEQGWIPMTPEASCPLFNLSF